ncbi:uncharacterized protein LOC125136279 [Phacochoerus africanus]|uniref:uncharacterized protein LOC125136279 n=1 Tax=Phacochoerus africanus TaxID=41426 RepID=UPI001FDA61DD|nr:uncharacterized protein LOC125136279 [Phacochoerus africanus]XP_047652941.1 uncharacterized protein LOC125136279 [Phacochoerus africanus]
MAALWSSRPSCIRAAFSVGSARAGFRRRQRNMLRRLKANHKRNHMDLVEGIWRELLDPYDGDSEDPHSPSSCGFSNFPLGDVSCHGPLQTLRPRSPGEGRVEDPLSAPAPVLVPPATSDVDMQPAEAGSPEVWGRAAWLPGPPGDPRMAEEDGGPREAGRHVQGRARVSRLPPRLGTERDKGPKRSLSKRKLELLLAEPEKNKRKRQNGA